MRGKFARVYVEVDLDKPLVGKLHILDYTQLVEYKGLHFVCFDCEKYGHHAVECKFSKEVQDSSKAVGPE